RHTRFSRDWSSDVCSSDLNTVNDEDIELYTDEARSEVLLTWRNIRQQTVKREGVDNKSLADFIAPKESGVADYIGMFAVTGGLEIGRASCRERVRCSGVDG